MQTGVIAVDVGSRQVRAGLFDLDGTLLASARTGIDLGQHSEVMATYRMQEIWQAAQSVVRDCAGQATASGIDVAGLAFDATSSLFAGGDPAPFGEGQGDVIGWMDHRAQNEALEISETRHPYLDYFSGAISPEIHLPKILWTSRQRPDLFDEGTSFRDVCDELAFRATGADVRSASALVCKWPYLPNEALPWCSDLLDSLGMPPDWCATLPSLPVRPLGARHGTVSVEAAQRLGPCRRDCCRRWRHRRRSRCARQCRTRFSRKPRSHASGHRRHLDQLHGVLRRAKVDPGCLGAISRGSLSRILDARRRTKPVGRRTGCCPAPACGKPGRAVCGNPQTCRKRHSGSAERRTGHVCRAKASRAGLARQSRPAQ